MIALKPAFRFIIFIFHKTDVTTVLFLIFLIFYLFCCAQRNAAMYETNRRPTLPLRSAVKRQAHLHATSGILQNFAASKIQLTINIRLR